MKVSEVAQAGDSAVVEVIWARFDKTVMVAVVVDQVMVEVVVVD
jgi:hypothetical protein